MSLGYCLDISAADWLTQSGTPDLQLLLFGPSGFEAYGRLRYIPDPRAAGEAEADAELPPWHPPDLAQARRAIQRLDAFTTTPRDCYFCVWEGYSDIVLPPALMDSLVTLPYRRYALLRGAVTDIDRWEQALAVRGPCAPPAFAWPADHSWCWASDVDPHWAGIGASPAAVEALRADPVLDVVPARPGEPQPAYG